MTILNDTIVTDEDPPELQTAYARKLNAEASKLEQELALKWWQPQPRQTFQFVIGAIVAGCLGYAFAFDNLVKNFQIVSDQATRLAEEKAELVSERDALEGTRLLLTDEIALIDLRATKVTEERDQLNEAIAELEIALFEARSEISRSNLPNENAGSKIEEISATLLENTEDNNYFPVVASVRRDDDVTFSLNSFQEKYGNIADVEVFQTVDSQGTLTFALTLGSNLSKAEATKRVQEAKDQGIGTDPYIWRTDAWGDNVAERFR